jgi:pilus assembly protein FimV
VVKQSTENQYDDDLTVGTDSYDDSYYTEEVDLFEFSTNDESPISRLKSLILSIDWEITDEVLQQFNEELIDLKAIWAGEKINLVYVQALEKISKYIYQFKADSHPNSIKLLLTLYYNLEKIVSSSDLTDQDKKKLLLDDVAKFEKLKRHISLQKEETVSPAPVRREMKIQKSAGSDELLLKLKAIVLGIDWEITDQDLNDLRQEVINLGKNSQVIGQSLFFCKESVLLVRI